MGGTQACAACGRETPMERLVYDDGARLICTACEADKEAKVAVGKSNVQMMIGPPLLALIGLTTICLPYLNIAAPFLFGIAALLAGIGSIRLGLGGGPSDGVTQNTKVILILSGCAGVLGGLGLMGINALTWLGLALS